jgi:tyrosyl-tRNA synthetase
MSKSLGNYVGIHESPDEMFGKLMSISDDLMWRYFELLSFRSAAHITGLRAAVSQGRNPRDVKFELAVEIIARFHSQEAAEQAQRNFIARFSQGAIPEDLVEQVLRIEGNTVRLSTALKSLGLAASTSEAMRKIEEGAVRVNQQKISDRQCELNAGESLILSVGKRAIAKVRIQTQ